ncbi:MAG: hypothetical protein NVS9B1_13340 [Candidatus Dormibacteraceae bacterium]
MPAEPFGQAPPAAPPAIEATAPPPPVGEPAPLPSAGVPSAAPEPEALPEEYPSWIAPEEITRLTAEKAAQVANYKALHSATTADGRVNWAAVHDDFKYSRTSTANVGGWRGGPASILIFILLAWFCGLFSLIFVWMTAWKTRSKVIVTIAYAGLFVIGVAFLAWYYSVHGLAPTAPSV